MKILSEIKPSLQPVDLNENIKAGDVVSMVGHRHERPVLDQTIDIIFENEKLLVVNKPSTMPIYPIGDYRLNTLLHILIKENGYRQLKNVHRIDKNTSGICLLVKGEVDSTVKEMFFGGLNLGSKFSHKEYVALVDGEFPSNPKQIWMDKPMTSNHLKNTRLKEAHPKEAITIFERLHYDPETNTSLVKCEPKTGRTHQIRRHLKMLGKFLFKIVVSSFFLKIFIPLSKSQGLQHNMKSKVINNYRIFCQKFNFVKNFHRRFHDFFWCEDILIVSSLKI